MYGFDKVKKEYIIQAQRGDSYMFKKKTKMKKVVQEYFKYSELNLKKTTFLEQKQKILKNILPFFEDKYIEDVNLKDIVEWKREIEKHNYKYHYKSYLFYSLSSILDFCVKYYDISKNYAKVEGNFKNTDINITGDYWTYEEYQKFINKVEDIKYKTFFELLFFSGLRKGEILGLTWSDIDFVNNTININKAINKYHEIQSTKSLSSNRIISINNKLIEDLKKLKNTENDEDLIFKFSFTTAKRKKDYYCKIAEVKQITIHQFRHSHSIMLYENSVPLDEIQNRLGHSSMSTTTDTYLKYLPKKEKRVIQLLNSI